MKLTSFGAAEGVTGSCHLLEVGQTRILLDCGMFQGGRKERDQNLPPLPIDPKTLDHIVVSHGHLDHIGRLPLFVKERYGFSAHGGQKTLTKWVDQSGAKRVLLVHGEEDVKIAFQQHLEQATEADEVHIMRVDDPVVL